jgi:hypothetical protein
LVPAHAPALADWHEHDWISYDVQGGVIFSAGVGYAMTGLSGDYFARGDWTTYVEKIDEQKVYVKITNVTLSDFDLVAGNIIASETLSEFSKSDDMFSYIFDFSDPRAQNAYEAMIHGSVKEAEALATTNPELAQLDLTENGHTKGHQSELFLGIPFLNLSDTSGELYNFSDTLYHLDNSKSDVQYGLYWKEKDSDVFSRHSSVSTAFYGIAYTDTPDPSSSGGQTSGKYGKFILSIANDHSSGDSVQDALSQIVKQTGLRQQLALTSNPPSGDLEFTDLSLTVVLSEAATQVLMTSDVSGQFTEKAAQASANDYFDRQGDPEVFCDANAPDNCRDSITDDVISAVGQMQSALGQMNAAVTSQDDAAFVSAYANFGKTMAKNEMTFGLVLKLIGSAQVDIVLQAEGSTISQLTQTIQGQAPLLQSDLN